MGDKPTLLNIPYVCVVKIISTKNVVIVWKPNIQAYLEQMAKVINLAIL